MISIHINCAVNYIRLNLIYIPSTRHIHIYKYTLIDTRAHALAHASTPSHTYNARIHTYIHKNLPKQTLAHIRTHTCARTYTHIHTYTHTHTHTHTHIRAYTHAPIFACTHMRARSHARTYEIY